MEQGKAHYFEDIEISGEGQILTISFTERTAAEYANKSNTNQLLLRLKPIKTMNR
jgi:hypothetical protein